MHLSNPTQHARHDHDLIAAHAAGDLSGLERDRADALLQSCTSCADLRRDLVAIAAATRALPPFTSATRDYRLDPAQAARLRRRGFLRSVLGPFAAPRSAVRPLAAAFMTLGLAGLLVASILPGLAGGLGGGFASGPAAAPVNRDLTVGAPIATAAAEQYPAPVALPAASGAPGFGAQSAGRTPGPDRIVTKDSAASMPPEAVGGLYGGQGDERRQQAALSSAPLNPLLVGSVALLGVGVALFGLRFVARRVR